MMERVKSIGKADGETEKAGYLKMHPRKDEIKQVYQTGGKPRNKKRAKMARASRKTNRK